MALRTPETKDEQDLAHNPSQQYYDDKFNAIVSNYSSNAKELQNSENNANGASQQADDTSDLQNQEANASSTWKGNKDAGWKTDVTPNAPKNNSSNFDKVIGNLKKKGPMTFIVSVLVGGGAGFSFMLAPAIGIVHLKEVFVQDLNDQDFAMEKRSGYVMRAKASGMQAGFSVCTEKVQVRCKFRSMGKREIARYNKNPNSSVKVKTEKTGFLNRERIVSMTFTAPDGSVRQINNPQDFNRAIADSSDFRSGMRQVNNPKFMGFWDGIAKKSFAGFKTDKGQKVNGNTDEERRKSVAAATAGESAAFNKPPSYQTETDADGNERRYVTDDNGNKVYASGEGANAAEYNRIVEQNDRLYNSIGSDTAGDRAGGSATKRFFGNIRNGLSLTGILDSACTVYNTMRAVSAAAKITRVIQLVQFAMVIFNVADRIKTSEATPGEVAFVGGGILGAVDMRKTIVDDQSIKQNANGDIITEPRDNPYYGKNAYDSEGAKAAFYNEAPTLTADATQYMVGGALSGSLAKSFDTITSIIEQASPGGKDSIRKTCKVVQSWWVRTVGLVAGLVSAVGTFGVATVATVAGSTAIGFALPYLTAALADIMAGKVINNDTVGPPAGNAAFAGGGALMGDMAKRRGMQPANAEQQRQYQLVAQDAKREYIADRTLEAQKTPFDVMNQYSFLGSMARSITPTVMRSTGTVSGALLNIPTIIGSAFRGVLPTANAVGEFNPERFEKCNDEGYKELGISADLFCNVRYHMPPEALNMDTMKAVDWMLANNHIDDNGEPKSGAYKDWIKNCVDRQDGWGETSNTDSVTSGDIGVDCVKKELQSRNVYFMVYTMDSILDAGLNEEDKAENTNSGTVTPSGEWAHPAGDNNYTVSAGFGAYPSGGPHSGFDMAFNGEFFSVCSGTVKSIANNGDSNGYPDRKPPTNFVDVDCGGGLVARYGHYYFKDITPGLKAGDSIKAGDRIARVGNQGYSTGAHLHLEIRQNGIAIDPRAYMKKVGVSL